MAIKILVVDDAEFMRLRLQKLLTEHGYEVVQAANGEEAVLKFREESPQLVLMDITMPVMDGIAALQHMKRHDAAAKVVMCSALGHQSLVLEALKSGARDFVVKPYQPDRVLDVVKKYAG